jgi:hypothetical protein
MCHLKCVPNSATLGHDVLHPGSPPMEYFHQEPALRQYPLPAEGGLSRCARVQRQRRFSRAVGLAGRHHCTFPRNAWTAAPSRRSSVCDSLSWLSTFSTGAARVSSDVMETLLPPPRTPGIPGGCGLCVQARARRPRERATPGPFGARADLPREGWRAADFRGLGQRSGAARTRRYPQFGDSPRDVDSDRSR